MYEALVVYGVIHMDGSKRISIIHKNIGAEVMGRALLSQLMLLSLQILLLNCQFPGAVVCAIFDVHGP